MLLPLTFVGPHPVGPKEIDGLLVSHAGKALMLLTARLITGKLLRSESAQEKTSGSSQTVHKYKL